eukprot:2478778-Ditylum_brightwellii.AAC.1
MINAKVHLAKPWLSHIQRQNDQHFMDVLREKKFSHVGLESLNFCWFYLRIEHVSDIIASDGTRLISLVHVMLKQQGKTVPSTIHRAMAIEIYGSYDGRWKNM